MERRPQKCVEMDTIVACVDGTSTTLSVCDAAVWAARQAGAPLAFLHVVEHPDGKGPIREFIGSTALGAHASLLARLSELDRQRNVLAQEHGRQLLEGAKVRAALAGISAELHQQTGALIDSLDDMRTETRLLVLGRHRRSGHVNKRHVEHTIERIVRVVHSPVLVTPSAFDPPTRFVVAYDGTEAGRAIVRTVIRDPVLRGLPCHIVTAGQDTPNVRRAIKWARTTASAAGADVEATAVVQGEPLTVLSRYIRAHDIKLLVIGAYGHSPIRRIIVGSTATAMLGTSEVSVLVAR